MTAKTNSASLVLSCLLCSVAQAWDGSILIGASGGWLERYDDVTATITHPTPPGGTTVFIHQGNRTFDDGYLLGLLAGYELVKDKWVVGIEANLDWHDKHHKRDDNIIAFRDSINQGWMYTPHYKTNAELGLTLRIAYQVFANFVPYVRIGPEFSSNRLRFFSYDPTQALFVEGDTRRYMTRLLAGLGVQVPMPFVVPGLSFRAEYNYHSRGKEIDCQGLARPDYATLWNIHTHPYTSSVKASVVWNLPISIG